MIVKEVVREHVETAAFQWAQHDDLARADPVDQRAVDWVGARLAAHLDGIRIAGDAAWPFIVEAIETYGEKGELFVAAFLALDLADEKLLLQVVSFAETARDGSAGLCGAFEWYPAQVTRSFVRDWITANNPVKVEAALAALTAHRVDPGPRLPGLIGHTDPGVRARACRLAAACGRGDVAGLLVERLEDAAPEVRLAAAHALATLGRGEGGEVMKAAVLAQDAGWPGHLRALVARLDRDEITVWLKGLTRTPDTRAIPIRAAGMIGDPAYAVWLVGQMDDPELAVDAGTAFVEMFPAAAEADLWSLEPADFPGEFARLFDDVSDPVPVARRVRLWLEQGHGRRAAVG